MAKHKPKKSKLAKKAAKAAKGRRPAKKKYKKDCWVGKPRDKDKSWLKKVLGVKQSEHIPMAKLLNAIKHAEKIYRSDPEKLRKSAGFTLTMRNFDRATGARPEKRRCP